jgi:hypothetical protein
MPMIAFLLATSMSVGGAAQENGGRPKEVDADTIPPTAEEACFMVREIRDFDPLSDEFILVEARKDENYLLTMFGVCIGLRNAHRIAISSYLSRVCSTSAGDITYRGLTGTETCRIRKVEAVEDKASAKRLVELRSGEQ